MESPAGAGSHRGTWPWQGQLGPGSVCGPIVRASTLLVPLAPRDAGAPVCREAVVCAWLPGEELLAGVWGEQGGRPAQSARKALPRSSARLLDAVGGPAAIGRRPGSQSTGCCDLHSSQVQPGCHQRSGSWWTWSLVRTRFIEVLPTVSSE